MFRRCRLLADHSGYIGPADKRKGIPEPCNALLAPLLPEETTPAANR
jgi:hypothetical protein